MNTSIRPQITAVIPTFRRPKRLKRAIESVLTQTYPHLKVAVSDNASGDETAEVVAEIARRDHRVYYHCHPENIGAAANFEYGMNAVDTAYFSFLSDDDLLLPGFYERAMKCLARNPEATFFCGQAIVFDPSSGSSRLGPGDVWRSGLHQAGAATRMMIEHSFTWTGCVFASELASDMRARVPARVVDVQVMPLVASRHAFVACTEPCAVLVCHQDTATRSVSLRDWVDSYEAALRAFEGLPGLGDEDLRKASHYYADKLLIKAGQQLRRAFLHDDWDAFDEAARYLLQRGRVSRGKRRRIALARRRGRDSLALWGFQTVLRLQKYLGRLRHRAGKRITIDRLVEMYGKARGVEGQ